MVWLHSEGFKSLVAAMTEGVIRTLVGGRDTRPSPLERCLAGDNFVIFELPHELDGDAVYVESDTAQRIYERVHQGWTWGARGNQQSVREPR